MKQEKNYKKRKNLYSSNVLSGFFKHSNEQKLIPKAVIEAVNPQKNWIFLDIGGGEGGKSEEIIKKVKRTVFIEPSSAIISAAKQNLKDYQVHFVNKKAEDLNGRDFGGIKKFDLILLSHVLNNIKEWEKALSFLLQLKNRQGCLIIIKHAQTGDYRYMLDRFFCLISGFQYNETEISSDAIISFLNSNNCKVKTKTIKTSLKFSSAKEALSFSKFIFLTPPDKIKPEIKKSLLNYFKEKKKNKEVIVTAHHEMIIAK